MKIFLFATLISFSILSKADSRWRDEKTGDSFLLLPDLMSWKEAHVACRKLGWDVFNYEYLSTDEQQRFLVTGQLDGLIWEPNFRGEPGERMETSVWGSSQFDLMPANDTVSGLVLSRFANEKLTRGTVKWFTKSDKHHVVCMYQSNTWESCNLEFSCTYDRPDGGFQKERYFLVEYGPHRYDALDRIKNRVKGFNGGVGARCELAPTEPFCASFR